MAIASLPADRLAENQVIAGVLYFFADFELASRLTADHFLYQPWRALWPDLQARFSDGRSWTTEDFPIELVTEAGIPPGGFAFEEAVKRLAETYALRCGFQLAQRMAKAAIDKDLPELQRIIATSSLPTAFDVQSMTGAEALMKFLPDIGAPRRMYRTGLDALDRVHFLETGYLLVLAARPGMGKSMLAHQIADGVATLYPDKHVVLCSPEMSSLQIAQRIAQARAGITRDQAVHDTEKAGRLRTSTREAAGQLANLHIIDRSITSAELQGQCRDIARRDGPVSLIITDHLRLLSDKNPEERHRLGRITFAHKQMAVEFDCPVLLLCQLNRAVESRESKRPTLSDLRDSGEVEENTDKVVALFREGYYATGSDARSGDAELAALKNRDGELFFTRLYFDAADGPRFLERQFPTLAERAAVPVVVNYDLQETIPF